MITDQVPASMTVVSNNDDVEVFRNQINEVTSQVDKLEKKVHEIESFFLNCKKQNTNTKRNSSLRDDKVRQATSIKRLWDYEAASERMQELIRQFGTILNQITQKKSGRSSLDYIGVKDLGLDNCCEVTGRPRDFSTIRKRMETKDASRYKHVREIYADVRSLLKSAMKCNDERSDAYVTAKTLLAKFEEKWLLLLPKVMQEEERHEEEAAFQQAHHAQMAKDICNELHGVEVHLKELKEHVVQRCRRMTTLEKRELGKALAQLSADNLRKALEIVAHSNPGFQASAEEVDLDIDAQDESTLRQLKYFIMDAWQAQGKPSTCFGGDNNGDDNNINTSKPNNPNAQRKRELSDAPGKTSKKKPKKSIV